MTWQESWAIGFGMNSRGAMEIILGTLALQYRVINEQMFVALVVMAMVTSIMSGPVMQRLLKWRKPHRFIDYMRADSFVNPLLARNRREAIRELAEAVSVLSGFNADTIESAVWAREEAMPTGISNGLAVPHARIRGLPSPVVGVGLSRTGVDFDSSDGEPARIIFMVLTPTNDDGAQLEIIRDIVKTLKHAEMREMMVQVADYTEFVALLKEERVQ
jgi:mannitol/fructose-specific phosphotransferase system IIA component (Ntr-type)